VPKGRCLIETCALRNLAEPSTYPLRAAARLQETIARVRFKLLIHRARRAFIKSALPAFAALALLGATVSVAACREVTHAENAPPPRPAMFKLTDSDSEIYLFGTVHILPPELKWRTPAFDAALAKANRVYFETPSGPDAEARAIALTQSLGMNPPGVTLDSYLTPAEQERLRAAAAKAGTTIENLQPMRPWLAAIMVSLSAMMEAGQDPNAGVENVIEAEAGKSGKSLEYFETIDEQLGLFAKLSEQSQKAILIASLDDIEEGPALTHKLDQAWVTGDLRTLDSFVNGDMRRLDMAVYKAILVNRNANWTKQIDALMQADQKGATIFIAVGAGHLAGKDGVPAMLEKLGYKVDRVQ
jgi:uncharacterized protein YbaP (TraB family)